MCIKFVYIEQIRKCRCYYPSHHIDILQHVGFLCYIIVTYQSICRPFSYFQQYIFHHRAENKIFKNPKDLGIWNTEYFVFYTFHASTRIWCKLPTICYIVFCMLNNYVSHLQTPDKILLYLEFFFLLHSCKLCVEVCRDYVQSHSGPIRLLLCIIWLYSLEG